MPFPGGSRPREYRPLLGFSQACESIRRATGIDFQEARARAGFSRGHLLEIVVYVPGGSATEQERTAAEDFVAALLGEELFETWIGKVVAVAAPRGGALRVINDSSESEASFPASELYASVTAARDGLLAGLSALPCCELDDDGAWTMLESEPDPSAGNAAQDDLLLATTCLPEMLKSFLQGQPFSSARFSRHGEVFAYLKVDQSGLEPETRLAERIRIEDALDAALRRDRLGAVIGNGLGLRHAYVNFALLDPERALLLLTRQARELSLPKRSWLLFFDTDCRERWLGVFPDSPKPPGL